MVIVGDKEVKNKTINVRFRIKGRQKEITIKKFLELSKDGVTLPQ